MTESNCSKTIRNALSITTTALKLQRLPCIDQSISKETKKKNREEERHVESRLADVSKSLQRIERGTQVLKRYAGETGREDRQTDRQTVGRTDGRLLSPSPQKQEAQPRYSSNFSRRNIHEQPRPSVLFRFYSPLQIGQPGSESLLYEAGNPCRWERLKGAAGGRKGTSEKRGLVAKERKRRARLGQPAGIHASISQSAATKLLPRHRAQPLVVASVSPTSIVSIRHREWRAFE